MALVDSASFLSDWFPEFAGVGAAQLTRALDQAAIRTPLAVWGDHQTAGHAYLTAHLLSILPGAKEMRIAKDGSNLYHQERKRLELIVSSGFRVTVV